MLKMYAFKKAFAMPLILKINHAVHQPCYYSLTFTCAVLDIITYSAVMA